MAQWSFTVGTFTPVAVADAAAMTNGGFMALQGGSSTQLVNIKEVYMGGQAGASSPCIMLLGRDSTVGATPTALSTPNSNGALHASSAALAAPTVGMVAAGTPPQRSNSVTLSKLNFSYNAFGGIIRWLCGPGEDFVILGNTASLGEASLSAFTGGTPGLTGAHIVYEPM